MQDWNELRFWYDKTPRPIDLYEFKRDVLLPALHDLDVSGFLILDEPRFLLLRIETSVVTCEALIARFEEDLHPLFSDVTTVGWSPSEDARNRILSAKRKLPGSPLPDDDSGWRVRGRDGNGNWLYSVQDLEQQVEAFACFMTRVLGNFTERYLLEMPHKVNDRWLMSVFLHLMLDSISVWHTEEEETRSFPFL
jgi:hypothetical protein